jgi:hypothetical protein
MPCVLLADDTTKFAEMLRDARGGGLRGGDRLLGAGGPSDNGKQQGRRGRSRRADAGHQRDAIADRLRRLYPELPILLMTGDAGVPFVASADAPVLRNPFRHEEFVDTIRDLLDP